MDNPNNQSEVVGVPEKFRDFVADIEQMNVLELAELVKVLEARFGVSAASNAPIVSNAAGLPDEAEEKSTFDVELKEAGGQKIAVIKVVRELTNLSLKEAKDLVDGAPKVVKAGVAKAEAEEIKSKLEAAGAAAEIK